MLILADYIKTIDVEGKLYVILTEENHHNIPKKYKEGPLRTFCFCDRKKDIVLMNDKYVRVSDIICIDPRTISHPFELLREFSIYHEIAHITLYDKKELRQEKHSFYEEIYCDIYALDKMGINSKKDIDELKNQFYNIHQCQNKAFRYRMSVWDKLVGKNLSNILNDSERGIYNRWLYLTHIAKRYDWRYYKKGQQYAHMLLSETDEWDNLY